MKTAGRDEWNTMPGYTRAERHIANHTEVEAAFNALDIGIDAETLSEFLRDPTIAIAQKIAKNTKRLDPQGVGVWVKDNNDLLTLVLRTATVLILAERERIEREAELARTR